MKNSHNSNNSSKYQIFSLTVCSHPSTNVSYAVALLWWSKCFFSQEMKELVQSSGENGIVVFTLGSMVTNMTEERANMIASALAQIPQKVHTVT